MIRVLLADDHAVVRQGLRTFLDLQDDIEVVAEAGDGAEAGYLLKDVEPPELVRAIRAAVDGNAPLSPTIATRVVEEIAHGGGAPAQVDDLTPRERDVLILIARGRSNKVIALELGVAEKTVKTHVSHVLAKLGLSDRTQAALYAVREGIVGPGA